MRSLSASDGVMAETVFPGSLTFARMFSAVRRSSCAARILSTVISSAPTGSAIRSAIRIRVFFMGSPFLGGSLDTTGLIGAP